MNHKNICNVEIINDMQENNELTLLAEQDGEWKRVNAEVFSKNDITSTTLSDLEIYKANSILQTVSGETIVTKDSANVRPVNLKTYGKSTQKTYEGNQLFDAKKAFAEQIEQGIVTVNSDGSVTLNGTFNANNRNFYISLSNGTYYFNETTYTLHHMTSGYDDTWRNITVTLEENKENIKCYIASGTYKNVTIYPQISTTINDDFEPFVGNQPSPNPDYPQEINSAENVEVKVLNGNLIDQTKARIIGGASTAWGK